MPAPRVGGRRPEPHQTPGPVGRTGRIQRGVDFLFGPHGLLGPDGVPNSLSALQMALRAVVVYGTGLLLLRLGGARILGRYSAIDIVLAILIGSVLSRAVNGTAPLVPTVAASAVFVGLHRAFAALACHSKVVSRLLKGRPSVLVRDGALLPKALLPRSLEEQDLDEAIRLAGHRPGCGEISEAWLERNGDISVVATTPNSHVPPGKGAAS